MIGPVLPVVRHLKLLDHQDVQMSGALHGVEEVEQPVLLASRCRGEDWTLQKIRVLCKSIKTNEYGITISPHVRPFLIVHYADDIFVY